MKKYLLASSIITIEHPKDFYGEIVKNRFILITHDVTFGLTPQEKPYISAWLTKEEINRVKKKTKKWTFLNQIKLNAKRAIVPHILTKEELDNLEFGF